MYTRANWPTYHYRAELVRVIDGDTIRVSCDLGMRINRVVHIRIADINAPEIFGRGNDVVKGHASTRALETLLFGKTIYISTEKDKTSFDRYVGTVYIEDDDGTWIDVAAWMVTNGWAVASTWT